MLDEMNDSNFIFNVFLLWWIIALLFVLLFLLETMDMLWKKEFWLLSVTMSFNFSDVKKFASKLKESVSSNVTSLLQNSNSGNNVSSSILNKKLLPRDINNFLNSLSIILLFSFIRSRVIEIIRWLY